MYECVPTNPTVMDNYNASIKRWKTIFLKIRKIKINRVSVNLWLEGYSYVSWVGVKTIQLAVGPASTLG